MIRRRIEDAAIALMARYPDCNVTFTARENGNDLVAYERRAAGRSSIANVPITAELAHRIMEDGQ
jgi:hypothetical protein